MPEEINSLEFPCDPSSLPTKRELPVGDLLVAIRGLEEKTFEPREGSTTKAKKIIELNVQVTEPKEYAGTFHRHTFWIGSDEDPNAKNPATWVKNGTDLMNLFKQAGVSVTKSTKLPEAIAAAKDSIVGVHSYLKRSKNLNDKTGEPWPPKVQIGSFWKPGTREVGVVEAGVTEVSDTIGDAPAPSTEGLSSTD